MARAVGPPVPSGTMAGPHISEAIKVAACEDGWPHALLLMTSDMHRERCQRDGEGMEGMEGGLPSGHDGITADVVTYNTAIRCCDAWPMEAGEVPPDVITYNTLMDVYQKCGQWPRALQVFDRDLQGKGDVISMNTAMLAMARLV
eukprot:Skav210864  [mRNA]  locus=scaffold4964:18095:19864:- [translate_table: standard]